MGLTATIMVMNAFKAAQPALLYIVPSVFLFTLAAAGMAQPLVSMPGWSEVAAVLPRLHKVFLAPLSLTSYPLPFTALKGKVSHLLYWQEAPKEEEEEKKEN